MTESVELPNRLGILPFRNKVLLPGAIIRIRCTSPSRFLFYIPLTPCWLFFCLTLWSQNNDLIDAVWNWWSRSCGREKRRDWLESCLLEMLLLIRQWAPLFLKVSKYWFAFFFFLDVCVWWKRKWSSSGFNFQVVLEAIPVSGLPRFKLGHRMGRISRKLSIGTTGIFICIEL